VEGGLDSSEDSEDSAQELARNGSNPRHSPTFRSPWSINASSPAFRSNTELLPPVDKFASLQAMPDARKMLLLCDVSEIREMRALV
jgi:hypothetical protein